MRNWFSSPSTIGLAVGFACLGGSLASARGPIVDQTVEISMWGLDGNPMEAAFTAVLPDGIIVKSTEVSPGNYRFDAMPGKLLLWVEGDEFGLARREITLPQGDVVHVDVVCVDPTTVEFLVDLGPNAKRIPGNSPFAGKAPINDEQGGAPTVGVPSLTSGSTFSAKVDEGLPEGDVPITSPGVWYIVPGDGTTITASTCGSADFDTKISVFCDGPESSLIAGNDDAGCTGPLHSTVSWCSEAGQNYLVLVHGFGGEAGRFQLSVEPGAAPCEGGVVCSSAQGDCTGQIGIRGACCLPNQECTNDLTECECEEANGTFQGPGTTCEGGFITYSVEECSSEFENIFLTGPEGPEGDDAFEEVPIGFDFTFFGNTYDMVKFSTNGYLTFGDEGDEFVNVPCPDISEPNNFIAPLWDDLEVAGELLLGTTHYETRGVAPNRRFIAQWTFVNEFDQPFSRATFQAVLFEADHCIEFRYDLLFLVPSFPDDTTVGIENADGTEAYCVPDSVLDEGVCIRFCPITGPPIECPCVTIDFKTDDSFDSCLVNGEIVSPNVNGLFGELLYINAYGSGVEGACIYDTDPYGPNEFAGDPDLLVDTGNALICQATDFPQQTVPGIFDHPNDNPTGGNIEICFTDDWGVETKSIDLIDVDPSDTGPPMQIFLTDAWGNCRVYSIPGGFTEDLHEDGPPGYRTLYLDTLAPQPGFQATAVAQDCTSSWFDRYHVRKLEIQANRSYAIDNLNFCRNLQDSDNIPTGQ